MKFINKLLICIIFFYQTIVSATTIYVNSTAQGLNNGTNWQNAFVDLQNALIIAQFADTIWVAGATYFPTDGTDRTISFEIPNGVAIFGGFEGTETQLSQRDWESHPTILSGDIGVQGDHTDNSYSVLFATQTDTTTTLDGLIVMHGNANSSIPIDPSYGSTKSGGGFFLDGQNIDIQTSMKINNCIFLNNHAINNGGAIFCSGQNGFVNFIISNSFFENNEAGFYGGAIGKLGGCNSVQSLISCNFNNNLAGSHGGAYWTTESNVSIDLNIENCNFINNEATVGGAISRYTFFNTNSNDLHISSCLFEGNISINFGGAIYDSFSSSGDIFINKCTFNMNSSTEGSGGAILGDTPELNNLVITQCIFFENTCDKIGGAINTSNNLLSINNLFYKNESLNGRAGGIRSLSFATLINNTFYKNKTSGKGAALEGRGEIKVLNSIFWKNEALNGSIFTFYTDANLEIEASIFDLEACDSLIDQYSLENGGEITCQPDVFFNIDPLFRDTANLDFSLLSCSPAINAGNTALIDSLGILEDLVGNNRVIDGMVDIGAYEQAIFSVTLDSVENETCFGNSNGAIYISSSGNPPFDISWQSENDSGTNTTGLSPGEYDFFITNTDGCSDTLSIEIEAATGLTTNYESNNASGSNTADGSINFEVISGGTPGYTYEWNTGAMTASISDLLPGDYFLTVTDAINCKYGFAFSVGITTGIEELKEEITFQIKPNPAHDFITIKLEKPLSEVHQIQLFDQLGRLVLKNDLPFSQTEYRISLEKIPAGFYHFYVLNNRAVLKTGKLVVF